MTAQLLCCQDAGPPRIAFIGLVPALATPFPCHPHYTLFCISFDSLFEAFAAAQRCLKSQLR